MPDDKKEPSALEMIIMTAFKVAADIARVKRLRQALLTAKALREAKKED